MMVARHGSRSPELIAARVAGSLAARAAAVATFRPAATNPIASIGPKQSGANSLTCPRPWSTSTQAPEVSCSCSRPAYCATRSACTAAAALITCCAPSTSAARSTPGRNAAPVWASSKASHVSQCHRSVRACENLSIMCSSVPDATDERKAYPQRKLLQHRDIRAFNCHTNGIGEGQFSCRGQLRPFAQDPPTASRGSEGPAPKPSWAARPSARTDVSLPAPRPRRAPPPRA